MSDKINRAYRFALQEHQGQRYGKMPYMYHLAQVVAVLQEHFIEDEDMICAAWLHDVIEDTPATREELDVFFGNDVSEMVWACTGIGKNRKERNLNIGSKMKGYPRGAIIKAADRIANIRSCVYTKNTSLEKMYRKEADSFLGVLDSLTSSDFKGDNYPKVLALQNTLIHL